jgi:nucleotide-binding universal stress UspA family protein
MFDSVLVPLDGSEFSEEALPLARRLARSLGARLHLVHVIRPATDVNFKTPQEDLEWRNRIREGADEYLAERAGQAESEEGLAARIAVLEGRPVPTLDAYLREHHIDLTVMTTHGAGGVERWWLGSVADGLLRKGASHILLVRPWDDTEDQPDEESPFRRVVVPLDGSEAGEAALGPARMLAEKFGASLTLIRVVPAPVELTSVSGVPGVRVEGEGHRTRVTEAQSYLDKVAARLGEPAADTIVVEDGSAAQGVIAGTQQVEGDLVVLSTHGRGGLARAVLGSVADKIIRGSVEPVLAIRPPDPDA